MRDAGVRRSGGCCAGKNRLSSGTISKRQSDPHTAAEGAGGGSWALLAASAATRGGGNENHHAVELQLTHALYASGPPGAGQHRVALIPYNAGMAGAASLRELAAGGGRTRAQRLYREDGWSWSREQADALRRRDVDAIDWENVVEEIETLGRSEEHAWTSLCTNVLSHLLKIEHSGSNRDLRHWREEVETWRDKMASTLLENPGMKGRLPVMLARAWRAGRKDAVRALTRHGNPGDWAAEKRMRRSWRLQLAEECPYSLEDVAGYDPSVKDVEPREDVWPAPVARALNEGLGTDYPIRFSPPGRGVDRGR